MQNTNSHNGIHGWLVIDKPKGISSYEVVARIKHLLKLKKVGHAGTLDLEATGLLAIALGEATKTIAFQTDSPKEYKFKVIWGIQTDTDDSTGAEIKKSNMIPKEVDVMKVLSLFKGKLEQVPPNYSAKKVNGERAYKLARRKIPLNLSPQKVQIFNLDLIRYDNTKFAEFFMKCSKGTYVRSVARDIGQALGCFGHADDIRRLSSGTLTIKEATKFDTIKELGPYELSKSIVPTRKLLEHILEIKCSESQYLRLTNGNPIRLTDTLDYVDAWASYLDIPIALGKTQDGFFIPRKVLRIV